MARIGRIALLGVIAALATAQAETRFGAQLRPQRVSTGEVFQLIVTVQTEDAAEKIPWPRVTVPPEVREAARNRQVETIPSIQIINGRYSQTNTTIIDFIFDYTAAKAGTFTVGPVAIALPEGARDLGSGRVVVEKGREAVHAQTILPARKVFVGQQIPFTWRMEADRPFQLSVHGLPDIRSALGKGFYYTAPDSIPKLAVVTRDGQQVGRLDITGSLFPLQAGQPELPSLSFKYQMVQDAPSGAPEDPFEALMQGRDPFESFFGQRRVLNGVAGTQPVPVTVRALPEQGRPAEFQGGVGEFRLSARLEKDTVRAGDGTTLTLVLEGNGQPQASGAPAWSPPEGVDAYPPEDNWTQTWKNGVLWSRLERKIVLVPSKSGEIPLGEAAFGYFDPSKEKYQILRVGCGALRVSASGRTTAAEASTAAAATPARAADRAWALFGRIHAALDLAAIAALLAWFGVGSVRRRLSPTSRRKARIRKALRRLHDQARQATSRSRAGHLRDLLVGCLTIAYGKDVRGLHIAELAATLERQGWPLEEIEGLRETWQRLDLAEFADVPAGSELEGRIRHHVEVLLSRIGRPTHPGAAGQAKGWRETGPDAPGASAAG